ncbi:hypothetical protein [Hymenobacter edaphi]|uniref:SMP domain-containing protein n=1 Tax=Hymenobacter edaphi TaxID=2211146 RepID=A0A328BSL1_9BACT|nr:hypothetical protein [Hymenobacter edaphi]RAK68068.1 hypothetical protein DLM85_08480 [Hymenobacter edaphi]
MTRLVTVILLLTTIAAGAVAQGNKPATSSSPTTIYQTQKQNGSGVAVQGMSSVSQAEADRNADKAGVSGSFQNATGTGTRFQVPTPAATTKAAKPAKAAAH